MEANKYYTPKVEEFHVGFEYEAKSNMGDYFFRTTFGDSNGEYNNELSEVYLGIKNNQIRVKYLDKEDIESLGFKETSNKYFKKDALPTMGYWLQIVIDARFGCDDIIIKGLRGTEEEQLFRGIIKNKSEFIKIGVQINIIKDEK